MARRKLTSYFFYRRRALLAYVYIFIALATMIVLAFVIPYGLTSAERASSVKAMGSSLIQVNAPYYLLQKASISLLGLSVFSIKLPSLLLGLVLGGSLFLLLRRWLTLGIAVFSSLIIYSGVTFLAITGTGSPLILFVLFPVLLLFFGTRVLSHDRALIVFAILTLLTVSLALLTPTMVYLLLLAIGLALFNPHVRYGIRRLPFSGRALLFFGFLAAITPVGYLFYKDPTTLPRIFAIPSSLTVDTIHANISMLLSLFARFLDPGIVQGMPAPLIGLSVAGLAIIGLYRIFKAIYTARAQFIVGWSAIALVLALIDNGFGILLYLPVVLLSSIGLSQLAAIWYRTFPLNPYARISALFPIGILIAGIVVGSSLRYVNTTLYGTGSANIYSHDLELLQHYMASTKPTHITLIVRDEDVPFYAIWQTASITKVIPIGMAESTTGPTISAVALDNKVPLRIIIDSRSNNADRFYVYK